MNSTDCHAPPTRDAQAMGGANATPGWLDDRPVVLIVDDTPDNLAFLSDTLQAHGYAVLVALSGEDALKCLARVTPDVVLLDAMMPGMDGFETCSRMKQDVRHEHLPVIFMTALTESEHVVRGFRVGGIDYVTKPVRPEEVSARIDAHVQRSRAQLYAHAALSLDTRAALIVGADGAIRWQSPQAARQIAAYSMADADHANQAKQAGARLTLPPVLRAWFEEWLARGCPPDAVHEFAAGQVRRSASATPAPEPGEWIVILKEIDDTVHRNALGARFGLTAREAEVLLWVSRGKTNRDIGDILGMAPRTVNKHLEHLFRKLHVETRAAAAALAIKTLDRA
ncbi:LuxR family two component transcriptional regulator [Paraburkholderia silvatlantica]|uniref:LuxR family two component transcriptional regulator n=2 Tax=Paraburkholderia silvatlantica TaxID=321895 RepID=A0A2V4TSH0_9BURK|nr:LuxR family two component transcriptional regulator [Paraburkholderia silvatlantica]